MLRSINLSLDARAGVEPASYGFKGRYPTIRRSGITRIVSADPLLHALLLSSRNDIGKCELDHRYHSFSLCASALVISFIGGPARWHPLRPSVPLDCRNRGRYKSSTRPTSSTLHAIVAECEGFEPPVPLGTAVFKTAAIDRSANTP